MAKAQKGADLASILNDGGAAEPATPAPPPAARPQPTARPQPASRERTPRPRPVAGMKPVRVTADLSPADYRALKILVMDASDELGQRVDQTQTLRALIQLTSSDNAVRGKLVTELRKSVKE